MSLARFEFFSFPLRIAIATLPSSIPPSSAPSRSPKPANKIFERREKPFINHFYNASQFALCWGSMREEFSLFAAVWNEAKLSPGSSSSLLAEFSFFPRKTFSSSWVQRTQMAMMSFSISSSFFVSQCSCFGNKRFFLCRVFHSTRYRKILDDKHSRQF